MATKSEVKKADARVLEVVRDETEGKMKYYGMRSRTIDFHVNAKPGDKYGEHLPEEQRLTVGTVRGALKRLETKGLIENLIIFSGPARWRFLSDDMRSERAEKAAAYVANEAEAKQLDARLKTLAKAIRPDDHKELINDIDVDGDGRDGVTVCMPSEVLAHLLDLVN